MNVTTDLLNQALLRLFQPGLTLSSYAARSSAFARALVGCDLTAFAAYTPVAGELAVDFDDCIPGLAESIEGFVRHMAKYPFSDFDPRSTNWKPFLRGDFVSERQFRDLDVYQEGFRLAGITDHSAIPIRTGEGKILYLGIERCGGAFKADEVRLLDVMQPHLENARALALAGAAVSLESIVPEDFRDEGLTCRESEVFHWIIQGKSNGEISVLLGLRLATVKSYVFNLFNKLGVSNRHAAILRGLEIVQRRQLPESSPARAFTRVCAKAPVSSAEVGNLNVKL
ncbi:MAG: helix-turn-helix transcriptional regulator [Verrucomicrobia bacterium]|nr:helix-turn-helix transcriptional regulator [Verrucomicrobiota bacterium]MCH8527984.1 helix-turn-helix transcriptional regulator [Kiritimatiellia bacterium]